MPIRPEYRKWYRTPDWRAARLRVLERAGGIITDGRYAGGAKCERCGKPDRTEIEVIRYRGEPYWRKAGRHGRVSWRNRDNKPTWLIVSASRRYRVVIAVCHRDSCPWNNAESNLAAWCQACHLRHDIPVHVEHARDTRSLRKDRTRPLFNGFEVEA